MRDCESLNLKQRYIILNYSAGGGYNKYICTKIGKKTGTWQSLFGGGGMGHFWHFSKNFSLKMK